jgi:hypothetical protein
MLCWSESLSKSCLISEISLLLKRPRNVPRMAPAAAAATYNNLSFVTVMIDGDGAGGVDGDVVGNLVKMEVSGCGWRRCGGRRRSDWKEMGNGEVSKRVVEEVGDVGFAGGKEGGGNVSVGLTLVEFAGKGFALKFTDYNSTSSEDILARLPRSYK